ncbi:hypothetical protein AFCA_002283 [Aspergillus flavus]|nr:hypothetical protein AFCA_002283 [Aspergillus flavus]
MHDTAVFNEGAHQIAAEIAALVDEITDLCGSNVSSQRISKPRRLLSRCRSTTTGIHATIQPLILSSQIHPRYCSQRNGQRGRGQVDQKRHEISRLGEIALISAMADARLIEGCEIEPATHDKRMVEAE